MKLREQRGEIFLFFPQGKFYYSPWLTFPQTHPTTNESQSCVQSPKSVYKKDHSKKWRTADGKGKKELPWRFGYD